MTQRTIRTFFAELLLWGVAVANFLAASGGLGEEGASSGNSEEEIRLAILVGIGEYREPALRLPYIAADVAELKKVLEASEYSVLALVDHQATKEAIEALLQERLKRCDGRTILLLYCNGHAVVDSSGQVFFLPVDADPQRLQQTGIPVHWIKQLIERTAAKAKFLFLDTCHAAGGDPESSQLAEVGKSLPISVHPLFENTPGVYVLASCQKHQKSYIWPLKGHSLFTYWLLQGLKGQADGIGGSVDGCITADELFFYTQKRVMEVAETEFKREQLPDRIVGPGAANNLPVVRVRPRGLDQTLSEISEELATVLQLHHRRVVAVLDFAPPSHFRGSLPTGGIELSRYCAAKIEEWLTQRTGGRFEVVLREVVQDLLRREGITTAEILRCPLSDLQIDGYPVEALVLGFFEEWTPPHVQLRVCLRITRAPSVSSEICRTAVLERSNLSLLDLSADLCSLGNPISPLPWEIIAERAAGPHPMSDPNFPFRVYVLVDGRRRPGKFVGNDLFVPLGPKEVYQLELEVLDQAKELLTEWGSIRSDADSESSQEGILMVRVLVDGLSTMLEPPRLVREGPLAKAINPEEKNRELCPAQPTSLEEASPWVFPVRGYTRRYIPGFVSRIERTGQASAGVTPITLHYRQFEVVEAKHLHSERWDYSEQLGIITAGFYTAAPAKSPTRSVQADVATKPGAEQKLEGRARVDLRPDHLLALIKVRYLSREAWEALKAPVVEFDSKKGTSGRRPR